MLRQLICAAFCSLPISAYAQDPPAQPVAPTTVREPLELVQYRQKFESELAQRLIPAKEIYVAKLKELELKRSLGEDYDGALRAKLKRLAVMGGGDAASAGRSVEGEISLPLSRGRRSGYSINYDIKRGALTGFTSPGQHITWDVMKVTPGLYRVLFSYGCGDSGASDDSKEKDEKKDEKKGKEKGGKTGGSFTFEEDTNLGTGEDRLLRHTVYPTGGWDKMVTRNIGRLRLTGTTSTLKLTALKPGSLGLMALRRIRLIPYTEEDSLVDGGSNALDTLRAKYGQKVEELVAEEFDNYVADLKALEEKLAEADRIREALAVKATRNEFELKMKNPGRAIKEIVAPE
jgi:hypothetical protein